MELYKCMCICIHEYKHNTVAYKHILLFGAEREYNRVYWHKSLWLCCPHWKLQCWELVLLSYVRCELLWSSHHWSVNIILLLIRLAEWKTLIYQETSYKQLRMYKAWSFHENSLRREKCLQLICSVRVKTWFISYFKNSVHEQNNRNRGTFPV
jgi:hypothetical protein